MVALIHPNGTSLSQRTTSWIKEVSRTSFMKEVIEASSKQPVLVDFWAPGCAPCRQFSPILEKLATAAKGRWLLAKINVEQNPEIAGQLRIQTLPTVYLFKDGRPVDGFMGAVTEAQILQFLGMHIDQDLADAESDLQPFETANSLWQQGSAQQALTSLLPFVQQHPTHIKAAALVVRCFYAIGYADKAQQFFAHLLPEIKDNPEFIPLHTLLKLISSGHNKDALSQLEQKKIENPQDLAILYDLSLRQFAEGKFEKSMENLMQLIQIDRDWPESRSTLIQMFEAIGSDHPFVHKCRRQLSTVLFS